MRIKESNFTSIKFEFIDEIITSLIESSMLDSEKTEKALCEVLKETLDEGEVFKIYNPDEDSDDCEEDEDPFEEKESVPYATDFIPEIRYIGMDTEGLILEKLLNAMRFPFNYILDENAEVNGDVGFEMIYLHDSKEANLGNGIAHELQNIAQKEFDKELKDEVIEEILEDCEDLYNIIDEALRKKIEENI